nr:NADH dehydrogenase subunit 5 [Sphaerodactylus elegans]
MPTMFSTALALTLTILTLPTLSPTLKTSHTITATVKLACLMSIIPTTIFINTGLQTITMNTTWLNQHMPLPVGFQFDKYSIPFLPIALFITWSILEFTKWYMDHDPDVNKFATYLLIFLLSMLILTTANNMLQLFVGWEGVGIMSFLLIGWWHGRANANSSALQAVIYNRMGDIGLILSLAWLAANMNTWEIQQTLLHDSVPLLPLLGIILAAMGKSAQFGLHPWLPAAMEGPTPVSALLHSSTMVVAGVFLLIRLHPMLQTNPTAMALCLCLGAMTTLFTALCAITQNDIKKIIAFSTSSQLGLMILTIGLNQPDLAFLHITTHAFFKAMLFLCSGSIIHSLQDEQDIRKMGGMQKALPLTTSLMTIGNLALAGTPYLAGFYTKDSIIEAMNTSHLNAWALTSTLVATALTTAYSLRMTFYTHLNTPRFTPTCYLNEMAPNQTGPILRLAMGSIISGTIMMEILTPTTPQVMTMGQLTKIAAILVSLISLACTIDILYQTTNFLLPQPTRAHTTLSQLTFYNTIVHRKQPQANTNTGQTISLQLNDLLWYEHLGPKMASTTHQSLTNKLALMQTGHIKTYLMMFSALVFSAIPWSLMTAR